MATNRKDVYSGMVTGQVGSFGRVSREKDIVTPPMRSGPKKKNRTYTKPKRATSSSWPEVEKTKSVGMSDLKQKSFERSFQKRLDSIDDDVLDVLFPEGSTKSINKFVAGLDEKWLFDGIGGYIRRALKTRRRGKRKARKERTTKSDFFSLEEKQLPGQTIGQMSGAPGSTGSGEAIDHDGDGMINDGTPEETRAPYRRSGDSNYEKQRRKFVKEQLRRQGIQANRRVEDRSKEERDARARARAAFDKVLRGRDGKPVADGLPKGPSYPPGQSVPKKYPPGQKPPYKKPEKPRDQKPADRYPNPEKKYPPGQKPSAPREFKPADRYPNPTRPDRKPADRYPEPARPVRPEDGVNNRPKPGPKPSDRKPADRYPNPSKPRDAEAERMERMRPKPRDVKPADRYPNPTRRDTKPADRYPEAPRGIRPEDGVNNRPKPSPRRTPGNNGTRKY